ncbi:hypothetical protein Vadar_019510 [Vaccinium darrowii]|uniref:Uncharacterized protein n=1 Tax=Vaccinium darrowii TaxID=229202 RepID=A0ACB7Y1P1_9ERIC|nr:hypothetical protein Vadar_019510 [Vaccinium darrowii]
MLEAAHEYDRELDGVFLRLGILHLYIMLFTKLSIHFVHVNVKIIRIALKVQTVQGKHISSDSLEVPDLELERYMHDYLKHLAFNTAKQGWNVVVSNHGGLGSISVTLVAVVENFPATCERLVVQGLPGTTSYKGRRIAGCIKHLDWQL